MSSEPAESLTRDACLVAAGTHRLTYPFSKRRGPFMPTPDPRSTPSEPPNDVLAKMIQAEVNEGGPPPAAPCDTPAEVVERIDLKIPDEQEPTARHSSR